MSKQKFKHLIADTTAFINSVSLNEYAENIYTIPDVMAEVKNKRQVRRLVVLPYDLQVKEPDAGTLSFVTNFAKKTGDYKSLSAIDLKVIALTYELERQFVGSEHLRNEPVVSKVIASKTKPPELEDKTTLPGFYIPQKCKDIESSEGVAEKESNENSDKQEEAEGETELQNLELVHQTLSNNGKVNSQPEEDGTCENHEEPQTQIEILENKESSEDVSLSKPESQNLEEDLKKLSVCESQNKEPNTESNESSTSDEDESDVSEDLEDEGTWITPSNINKLKKDYNKSHLEDEPTIVACMSTDYAIQNVLKQINLSIAALDGRVIKNIRTYILRCHTCFKTTSIMTKVFCPNCGHKTLKRVAVSLDENGQQVIHINTKRPLTAKYSNQSIPRPKGGKHSRNPILVEDQPLPKQMPSRVAKTKTNALNEDYTVGYSPFVVRDVDSKSALLRGKGNIKQWARNNEYEEARRRKHFNRLVK